MIKRQSDIYYCDRLAGRLSETDAGYRFIYDDDYMDGGEPISLTLPLQAEPFEANALFSFFEGLLPEGWYLEIVSRTLKIDPTDKFGLLLKTCGDCIGAVNVREVSDEA
ncbi:MAG: HipA N-terminal domain-containing protein [Phycisphaerae bacterium]|nr:HipA N-terminal domain-containing protein [Phycisphaerae bacterium]